MEAVVLLPGEGEHIEVGTISIELKATADMTGGAFSISETTLPAGMAGPPPHVHERLTDTFYVLEGSLRVQVGSRELTAPAGSFVLVPPGVAHTFANDGVKPARFLNINAPGGWEHYLRDLANAVEAGIMPGSPAFAEKMARHDFSYPE